MKLNAVLLSTLLFAPFPAHSQQYNVRDECYRNVEQYIPGYTSPDGRYFRGRVRTTRESIPCGGGYYSASQPLNQQPVRCGRNQSILFCTI